MITDEESQGMNGRQWSLKMTDQEIHSLRSRCHLLEKDTRQLESAKRRLESRLVAVQQSLQREQCATKNLNSKRVNDLLNLQRHYVDKFETATKLLKIKLHWELTQALQFQQEQLKTNFRSDLCMLTSRNNQLASLLTYAQQQLQQVDRVTENRRVEKQLYRDDAYDKKLRSLRKDFEKQTIKLLKELKDRERTIESLQRSISNLPNKVTPVTSSQESYIEQFPSFGSKSGGPVRNKSHRGIRVSKNPYTTNHGKKPKCATGNEKMKELETAHVSDSDEPFSSHPHQNNTYHHYNYPHQQQYVQCTRSGLETLPEADSEEESSTTGKDDDFPTENIPTNSPSSQISLVDYSFQSRCKIQGAKSIEDFTIEECEAENHKVSLLESIIQQLRDELRECKDQNELLEFRLLEIQEVNSMGRQHGNVVSGNLDEGSSKVISCLPLSDDGTNDAEYDGSNCHTHVTESRSSCSSDCSESLSLQESGIFESQGSDDGTSGTGSRTNISRDLANLTFQIEELLRGYNDVVDETKERSPPPDAQSLSVQRRRINRDVTSDLQSCRQKIQEFEKRLSQMNNVHYLQNLEEKVNFLVSENKRLDEERAEIEEAENDNRNLCQRLEENTSQLLKKKLTLQNKLALEKRQIEQLRSKIFQMQEREEGLLSKITKLEGLLQIYEQRNFELEETCIELKSSIHFVIHSMPTFSLCYFWYLSRNLSGSQPMLFKLFMKNSSNQFANGCPPNFALPWINNKTTLINNSVRGSNLSPRKHKLLTFPGVEPELKKCKSLKDRFLCDHPNFVNDHNMISSVVMSRDEVSRIELESIRVTNSASQTGEEGWKIFIDATICRQREEWEKVEKSLRKKIEFLECDIDKVQDLFDQERNRLIEMYEAKLCEKEAELKENIHCQNEKRELQDKWNCLIQELEQFALYMGNNLNKKAQGVTEWGNCDQLCFSSTTTAVHVEKSGSSCNSVVTNNEPRSKIIHSNICQSENPLSPSDQDGINKKRKEVGIGMLEKAELIAMLQSRLRDHLSGFEMREQQLLGEIDRLLGEIKANAEQNSEVESNMITHLTEENHRLQGLFKDHDKVWGDFKRLEDEHERLKSELSDTMVLRKRLEESHRSESGLRERLEEIERAESCLKNQLDQMERKEQKGLEKIQQLRDEIQFLRNKCCQLQDDLDMRVAKETKYKNEIQILTNKLRESTLELEEKESQLESSENALQSQITKLKAQLQDLHQSYTDTECSNGMLKEEVSYLEKTVEEAVSKAVNSESAITALSYELKQKDVLIEELQTQLRQLKMTGSVSLSPVTPHELSDFNGNDGGLHGVVRSVEEVVSLIQQCSQCESASTKLMGIVDRLIPLIQILKSSHVTDFHFAVEPETTLSRYESDDVLALPYLVIFFNDSHTNSHTVGYFMQIIDIDDHVYTKVQKTLQDFNSTNLRKGPLEEDEALIERLQNTMTRLAWQISELEKNLDIRQRNMKNSHLAETNLWKRRCDEKNSLIRLLAIRIAHLSAADTHGYFVNGIIKEIEKLRDELILTNSSFQSTMRGTHTKFVKTSFEDFCCDSLRTFLDVERRRIRELFENPSNIETAGGENDESSSARDLGKSESKVDFRVTRQIGEDALLVSWTMPDTLVGDGSVSGYEIAVNGSTYLKISKPNRHKAVLFGLNLDEPLRLTLKCSGDPGLEDSTITFIS